MKLYIYLILFSFIFSDDLKNVQVLDITSNREMKKYMKSISKDLGTKCKSCHIMDDKSLDTPKKAIAREMITLTRQINDFLKLMSKAEMEADNFYNKNSLHDKELAAMRAMIDDEYDDKVAKVTCWTCHKGKLEVEQTRPVEE